VRALVVVAVLLLAGCTAEPGVACTEIGAQSGLGVTVDREIAAGVTGLTLRICDGSACSVGTVELLPGSETIPSPCPTDGGPDTTCSAESTPDGTLVGFVAVDTLPSGSITVSGTLSRGAKRAKLASAQVTASVVYPNGPGCDGEANQAQIVIDENGIRQV
jgi:hypothetical protein